MFLIGNGLEQRLAAQEAQAANDTARYALRREVQQLTLPSGMGERFQAMGFERDVPFEAAFLGGDLSFRL
jgi:SAM-dependent MidA family methyltransferase